MAENVQRITYTCRGNVRGCCEVRHGSLKAASKCQQSDQRACKKVGGYSDRKVVRINEYGRFEDLSEGEFAELNHHLIY
jgi:hypothetical protein